MLSDVIANVNLDFAARGVLNAQALALTCAIGGDELLQHEDAPPRIIVTPDVDSYVGPKRFGGQQREILCRNSGAAVHIWGASLAATEALINDFILSVHRFAFGSYEIGGGKFTRPKGGNVQCGLEYVLRLTIYVPITDTSQTRARILHAGPSGGVFNSDPTVAPSIASLVPSAMHVGGGALTINGARFSAKPIVLVGGVPASSVVRVSASQITCVVPPLPFGYYVVEVLNEDGNTAGKRITIVA